MQLMWALALGAAVQVPVQGALVDDFGGPISGARQVTFRFYDDPAGGLGHRTWSETQTVIFANGAFSASLGAVDTLDTALLAPAELFLTVALADGPESDLTAVGYAARAGWSEDSRRVGGQSLSDLDARFAPNAGSPRYVNVLGAGDAVQSGGFKLSGDGQLGGVLTASSFSGNGAGLTSVNAAQLGGLTLTQLDARFAAATGGTGYVRSQSPGGTPQAGGFDLSGNARISGSLTAGTFVGDGSALTAVDAAELGGQTLTQLDSRYVGAGDARLTNARAPTAGSSSYIQNNPPGGTAQGSAGFNVDGAGRVGGTMTAAGGFVGPGTSITGVDAARLGGYSVVDLYHGMMNASASAACRAIGASTGCCGNFVVPGGGTGSCNARCAAMSAALGNRVIACDGAVTIGTRFGPPSEGMIVASYYNYGCGGSGGNAGSPINLTSPNANSNSYLEYCCCRAQ